MKYVNSYNHPYLSSEKIGTKLKIGKSLGL